MSCALITCKCHSLSGGCSRIGSTDKSHRATGAANKPGSTPDPIDDNREQEQTDPEEQPGGIDNVSLRVPKGAIYGGTVAAPAFQQIVSFAMPYLGIQPR